MTLKEIAEETLMIVKQGYYIFPGELLEEAQKVSEKMALIGKSRQVICITHLAQIAAMADSHFLIEKQVQDKETRTRVRRLSETESVEELARILGGAQITQTVRESAREMKTLAAGKKC